MDVMATKLFPQENLLKSNKVSQKLILTWGFSAFSFLWWLSYRWISFSKLFKGGWYHNSHFQLKILERWVLAKTAHTSSQVNARVKKGSGPVQKGKDWEKKMPLRWSCRNKWQYRELPAVWQAQHWLACPAKSCWRKRSPKKAAWIEPRTRRASYKLYSTVSCLLWHQETKVSPKNIGFGHRGSSGIYQKSPQSLL